MIHGRVDPFRTQFDDCHPFPSFSTCNLDAVDNGCMGGPFATIVGWVGGAETTTTGFHYAIIQRGSEQQWQCHQLMQPNQMEIMLPNTLDITISMILTYHRVEIMHPVTSTHYKIIAFLFFESTSVLDLIQKDRCNYCDELM